MAKKRTSNNSTGTITLEVPIDLDPCPIEFRVHIDTHIDAGQATCLRRIYTKLDAMQATTKSGKRVIGYNDAIKWLLEQLECGMEKVS